MFLQNPKAPFLQLAKQVVEGKYEEEKVFIGLIEAMVQQKDRESRGIGKQNFHYSASLMEFAFIVRDQSPQTYNTIKKAFQLPVERSLRCDAHTFGRKHILTDSFYTKGLSGLASLTFQ